MRCILMASVIAALLAETASAQVLPGDSPGTGIGAAVANSRSRPLLGISRGQTSSEPEYQSRGTPSAPNRKPSGDPWAGIRQTPSTSTYDRHRAY